MDTNPGFVSRCMDTNLDTLDTNLRFVSGFVSIDFWIRIHRPMRCRSRSRHGPSCMIPNQADAFNLWFLKGVTCGCSYYFAEDKNRKNNGGDLEPWIQLVTAYLKWSSRLNRFVETSGFWLHIQVIVHETVSIAR